MGPSLSLSQTLGQFPRAGLLFRPCVAAAVSVERGPIILHRRMASASPAASEKALSLFGGGGD